MNTTHIYTLTDPITNHVRYVGKSNNLSKRLHDHCIDKRMNHRAAWIRSLIRNGTKPVIESIDIVPMDQWQFWEQYWMGQFRAWGYDLTNATLDDHKHVEEKKKLMSEKKTEWYRHNLHYKLIPKEERKISKRKTRELLPVRDFYGANNPMFGRKRPEVSERLRKMLKGKTYEERYGAERAKEIKARIGKGITGRRNLKCERPVEQYDLTGNKIKDWPSMTLAAKFYGVTIQAVFRAASSKSKSSAGYIWKYKN